MHPSLVRHRQAWQKDDGILQVWLSFSSLVFCLDYGYVILAHLRQLRQMASFPAFLIIVRCTKDSSLITIHDGYLRGDSLGSCVVL